MTPGRKYIRERKAAGSHQIPPLSFAKNFVYFIFYAILPKVMIPFNILERVLR